LAPVQRRARLCPRQAAAEIAKLTHLPFVSAPNSSPYRARIRAGAAFRYAARWQGALYKIGQRHPPDSSAPRRFAELIDSRYGIRLVDMPGRSIPTRPEALTMIAGGR